MAEPPSALNGRVLDPSAVASWTEGRLAVQSWLGVAGRLGLTMIVPELAVEEIAKLRPEADGVLWRLKRHPQVLLVFRPPSADLRVGGGVALVGVARVPPRYV